MPSCWRGQPKTNWEREKEIKQNKSPAGFFLSFLFFIFELTSLCDNSKRARQKKKKKSFPFIYCTRPVLFCWLSSSMKATGLAEQRTALFVFNPAVHSHHRTPVRTMHKQSTPFTHSLTISIDEKKRDSITRLTLSRKKQAATAMAMPMSVTLDCVDSRWSKRFTTFFSSSSLDTGHSVGWVLVWTFDKFSRQPLLVPTWISSRQFYTSFRVIPIRLAHTRTPCTKGSRPGAWLTRVVCFE